MNKVILIFSLLVFSKIQAQEPIFKDKFDDAIPVLNFGTFHRGFTSDATSVDFDEHNKKKSGIVNDFSRRFYGLTTHKN